MSHKVLIGGVILAGAAALLLMSQTGNLGFLSQSFNQGSNLAAVAAVVPATPTAEYNSADKSVTVKWSYFNGASNVYFKLVRACGDNASFGDSFVSGIPSSAGQTQYSYKDDGLGACKFALKAGQKISYKVAAYVPGADNKFNPTPATVTLPADVASKIVKPGNFKVELIPGTKNVRLSWDDNSVNEQGYRIHRRVKGTQNWTCCFKDLEKNPNDPAGGRNSVIDDSTVPGTTYEYMEQTVGRNREHETTDTTSTVLSIPIPSSGISPASGQIPPPSNVKAAYAGGQQATGQQLLIDPRVNVTWDFSSNITINTFKVLRACKDTNNDADFVKIREVSKDNKSLLDTDSWAGVPKCNFAKGQTISYKIMAANTNTGNNSNRSPVAKVTLPTTFVNPNPSTGNYGPTLGPTPGPTNLQAKKAPNTANDIDLTWTDNSSNEKAFEIRRSTSANGPFGNAIHTTGSNETSWRDTTTANCTTYYYQVVARRAGDYAASGHAQSAAVTSGGPCTGNTGGESMQGGESSADRPTGIRFETRRTWYGSKYTYVKWDYPGSNSGTRFTVKRGGTVLTTTTAEDYSDKTARTGQTYQYEVCVQGSTTRCAEPKSYTRN
jgi:hypothetical protein